jgi:hypothetical protein
MPELSASWPNARSLAGAPEKVGRDMGPETAGVAMKRRVEEDVNKLIGA